MSRSPVSSLPPKVGCALPRKVSTLALDVLLDHPGPSQGFTLVSNGIELFSLRDSPLTDIDIRPWTLGSFVLHHLNSSLTYLCVTPLALGIRPSLPIPLSYGTRFCL